MPEKYTYLLVDLFCIIFPLAFSFHPKINFFRQWRYFVIPCLSTALFFLVWDVIFTDMGVWSFNHKYVLGLFLLNLPVEEYLFFLCIPYACVFTYFSLGLFFNFSRFNAAAKVVSWALVVFLTIIATLHLPELYTSCTFLMLAFFISLLLLGGAQFLAAFYTSFLLILIPFFISNGVLTGSGLQEPVVAYNNHYNLGIRMLTIPLEDTFYGMLLLLMNVAGFEFLKDIKTRNTMPPHAAE